MKTDKPDLNLDNASERQRRQGVAIRLNRKLKKLSIAELSRRIRVPVQVLEDIEEGRVPADTALLQRLSKALKADISAFLTVSEVAQPVSDGVMRDVDLWFCEAVYPNERDLLWVARTLTEDRESARDLVHEAYAQVLVDDRWRKVSSAKAYLIQTVVNLGRKLIRHRKIVPIRPMAAAEVHDFVDVAPDAFEVMASREELSRVLAAIDQLPPQRRKVVYMRKLQDIPLRDVARRLDISLSSAETHLSLGMAALADILADEAPRWVGPSRSKGKTAASE